MPTATHGRLPHVIHTLMLCDVVQHCTKLIAAAEGLVGQLPTHELARWYTLLADLQSQRAEQARSGAACKPGALASQHLTHCSGHVLGHTCMASKAPEARM